MEVYATIFMIFVSHVLSSFTQTFSSRQKDGRHISIQPKIRRMVYFKNHNSDEKNQRDNVLEHVMPFINGDREQTANRNYGRNIQYGTDEIARIKKSDINSPRESIDMMEFESNLRSPREEKPYISNENIFCSTFTPEHPFHIPTVKSEVILKKSDENKTNNITSTSSSATEMWENKVKLKFVTIRPWNQFCLTCDDTPNKLKDDCVRCSSSYHTKRKKNNTPFFSHVKSTTTLNKPWLFFAGPIKTRKPDKCSKSVVGYENKLRSTDLNGKRNNFLLSKSQLDILKSALKRNKKDTNKNSFLSYVIPITTEELMSGRINILRKKRMLDKNIYHNKLMSRISKLKSRSLNLIGNEKDSDLVGFISFGRRNKNRNFDKGIPPCQKSSSYNISDLVNAQTIKPVEYFRRKPAFLLCCEDGVSAGAGAGAGASTSISDAAVASSALTDDSDMSLMNSDVDSSTVPDDSSSVVGDWQSGTTGSYPDLENFTAETSSGPDSSLHMTTDSDHDTTPTVLQMFMQLRAIPIEKSITEEPKGIYNPQVVLNKQDELINLNGENLELKLQNVHKPLYYLISFKDNDTFEDNPNIVNMVKTGRIKKIQPWDKFCPCSGKRSTISNGGTDLNRQPWISACVACISTMEDNSENVLGVSVSTEKSDDSVYQIISKPLEEEDLDTNSSRPDRKPLLLIRVPISGIQKHGRNTSTSNSTSNTKHVKPRSILDLFMPSLLRKSTMRPIEHVIKPWEEPWKFRPEKSSLFTTFEYATFEPGDIMNPSTTAIEHPLVSKNILEYIADTYPSCSKNKKGSFLKAKCKHYDGIETSDELSDEDIGSDNSTSNYVSTEKSDSKYLSDVLKLTEIDLIEVSSPAPNKVQSLKGLTILQSLGSPPKYFIEVPELWTGLKNIAVGAHSTSLPPVTLTEKSTTHPEKMNNIARKKITILCLQPFDINGNNVYLPMSDLDIGVKEESSTSVAFDLEEEENNSNPRRKTIMHGFIDKNDSALPFVLVPAYLAMHSQTTLPRNTLQDTNYMASVISADRKISLSERSGSSKIKDQVGEHLNTISLGKKMNTVSNQLNLPITPVSHTRRTKKSSRKPSFSSRKPSLIILMNGIGSQFLNSPELPLDEGDFSFMDQKVAVTIEPIEDYLLI